MDQLFYELVQVGLGRRQSLSRTPSQKEWMGLLAEAGRQSVMGVCFAGVRNLAKSGQTPERPLYLKWIGRATAIQKRNQVVSETCNKVRQELLKEGMESCVLKGQGVAAYYGEELSMFRQCGDIDLWVNAPMDKVIEYVKSKNPNRGFDMKHISLGKVDGVEVELHWRPSVAVSPLYRKALDNYYDEQAAVQCCRFAPDICFETIHVLEHILVHFLYEGVGFRQLMDLYFLLTSKEMTSEDRSEIWKTLKRFRLTGFAAAVMWVLEKAMLMDPGAALCEGDEKTGRKLLREVERGGDFGHHNKKSAKSADSFNVRMLKRFRRRLNLIQYNPMGVICGPFTKLRFLCWRKRMIRKYEL